MTRLGAYLEKRGIVPDAIWRAASTNFANVARGTARVVQLSAGPRTKSIWLTVELPILASKGITVARSVLK